MKKILGVSILIVIIFSAIKILKTKSTLQPKDKKMAKFTKSVVVAERIVEDCPFRGELKKKQYAMALKIIGEKYKELLANDKLKILTCFTGSVEDGFKLAKQEGSLAVIGYYNSASAIEASVLAKQYEVPYVSPVSPLAEVNNDFSVTLATPHNLFIEPFKKTSEVFPGKSIILCSNNLSLVEEGYIDLYKKSFDVQAVLKGNSDKTIFKLESYLKSHPTLNILLSGYAYDQLDLVRKIKEAFPSSTITFVAHTNWTYMEHVFKESFSSALASFYVISDFYPHGVLPDEAGDVDQETVDFYNLAKETILREDKSYFEPIVLSFLNAIKFSVDVASNIDTPQQFNNYMANTSNFSTYQNFNIVNKQTQKKVYLLRWQETKLALEKIL